MPFCGLNANTKVAIAARKEQLGGAEATNADYMASSPAATYDTSRNKRLLARVAAEEEEELCRDDNKESFVLNTSEIDKRSDNNVTASDC